MHDNTFRLATVSALVLLAVACHQGPSEQAAPADEKSASAKPAQAEGDAGEGVALKPEEVQTMGITTTAAQAVQSAPEVQGFGVVLAHETIATAVAEVRTAIAAERQSRAALERTHRLAGTPGAMPAETQENAERQAVADQAALELARQKLSSSFGPNPPWKNSDNSADLRALASGADEAGSCDFPVGAVGRHGSKQRSPDTDRWQQELAVEDRLACAGGYQRAGAELLCNPERPRSRRR